ncbi:MAG: L,D-transpeptidase family protein [Magnetococcales bacterium]|nr:L,D-transpeptidase family protein [Magnetococcales bacterium]
MAAVDAVGVAAESSNRHYSSGLNLRAEQYLSTVSLGEVPWRRRWYPYAPGDEVLDGGELRHLVQGQEWETLVELARLYDLGFNALRDANPTVNVWLPEPGAVLKVSFRNVLPRSTARIVVNLPEMRVYHKRRDGFMDTYPIGIGREGLLTPVGSATVVRKTAYPSWYVPESIRKENRSLPRVIPSGPDNPLGTHAIYLSIPGYLMHGTQKPYGVGRRVSHGCMRLYPEDIVRFFAEVAVHDSVQIVNQSVKAGWQGEQLLLQVHDVLSIKARSSLLSKAKTVVAEALARRPFPDSEVVLDWKRLEQTVQQMRGVPVVIGHVWHPPPFEYVGVGWAWEKKLSSYISRTKSSRPASADPAATVQPSEGVNGPPVSAPM